MKEGNLPCVKTDAAARIGTRRPVFEISLDDASDAGELAPDLVVSSRHQLDFEQMIAVCVGEEGVTEPGGLGAGCSFFYDKGFVGLFVAGEPVFEGGLRLGRGSAAECPVSLVDIPFPEHGAEPFQSLGGLGKEADAAHGPVQPVRDAYEDLPGFAVPGRNKSFEGFGKGFIPGLVTLDDLAGPLVEHQQVIVFVEDACLDVSRLGGGKRSIDHSCQFFPANILTIWHKNQLAQDWIFVRSSVFRQKCLNN